MSLADLIRPKNAPTGLATAIPAIPATDGQGTGRTVARIATVAVANPRSEKSDGAILDPCTRTPSAEVAATPAIPPGPFQNFEADSAHRVWLVAMPNGERFASRCTPPATLAEVRGWHPAALSLEPEDDSEDPVETGPEDPQDIPEYIGAAPASRSAVVCCTCRHWRRDTIGDGSGLGACAIDAPASREPGTLWPNSVHRCGVHLEATP